jgi:signal transduction histidine kinase/CheY-like chemotaxis protein
MAARDGNRGLARTPTFDEIFAVMSAASVGDTTARVVVPDAAALDDPATKLAIGLNLLLDDLAFRSAEREQAVLENTRLFEAAEARAQQLQALRNDLERRVAERTAELEKARHDADHANQAKSEFLSRMSHELRTPLNAVIGFAQLLEMDALSAEHRESVGHILKGGRHLLELINEVLDIARIEAGRLAISPEPVSVNLLVKESLDLIAPLAVKEHVHLDGNLAETSERHVQADRQRLRQVLLNLLSNAVKYNRKGGAVTFSYEETPEARLRIKVTDTGPGISAEKMERLFTPFERLGVERTSVEGTGLGLALSKRLVEAMDGKLGVESTVGRGSTFWVELPLVESLTKQSDRGEGVPTPGELVGSRPARVVLYVEDNLSNLRLIERVLAHRPDIRLHPAMQGRLGLDLAREHRPDLILLDLHLPDMPGEELLLRLRAIPETREIPVVVISADATPGQVSRLLASGARAYLTKPLDLKKFLALLDEVLQ